MSETLVNFYQIKRRYNPEDSRLRTHRTQPQILLYKIHPFLISELAAACSHLHCICIMTYCSGHEVRGINGLFRPRHCSHLEVPFNVRPDLRLPTSYDITRRSPLLCFIKHNQGSSPTTFYDELHFSCCLSFLQDRSLLGHITSTAIYQR
jgi:hypothetical protein